MFSGWVPFAAFSGWVLFFRGWVRCVFGVGRRLSLFWCGWGFVLVSLGVGFLFPGCGVSFPCVWFFFFPLGVGCLRAVLFCFLFGVGGASFLLCRPQICEVTHLIINLPLVVFVARKFVLFLYNGMPCEECSGERERGSFFAQKHARQKMLERALMGARTMKTTVEPDDNPEESEQWPTSCTPLQKKIRA